MVIIIKPYSNRKDDCNDRKVKSLSALSVHPEANKLEIKQRDRRICIM